LFAIVKSKPSKVPVSTKFTIELNQMHIRTET
jgi:hypothetical protein